MRYALTGATQFVGGHLARQLRRAGHGVVAVVRNPAKATDLEAIGVEVAPGDVTSRSSLVAAFGGVDGSTTVARVGTTSAVTTRSKDGRSACKAPATPLDAAREAGSRASSHVHARGELGHRGQVRDRTLPLHGSPPVRVRPHEGPGPPDRRGYAGRGLDVVTVMPEASTGRETPARSVNSSGRPPTASGSWHRRAYACAWHTSTTSRPVTCWGWKGRAGESYMLAGPQTTLVEVLRITSEIAGGKALSCFRTWRSGPAKMMAVLERVAPVPSTYRAESLRASRASYLGSPAKANAELGWFARPLRHRPRGDGRGGTAEGAEGRALHLRRCCHHRRSFATLLPESGPWNDNKVAHGAEGDNNVARGDGTRINKSRQNRCIQITAPPRTPVCKPFPQEET